MPGSDFMKRTEEFLLFWGGPCSQWAIGSFEVDGIVYNCAEQYMMAEKARLFNDDESLEKIMNEFDPGIQKAFGRKVKGFNSEQWDAISRDVVFKANVAKFTQIAEYNKFLLETGELTIVEASPYDKIWGIGLGVDDPKALDPAQWQGKNWLGEVLMKVRSSIF